jgi:phosphatidyl-myo-inositol dimannoside synthase
MVAGPSPKKVLILAPPMGAAGGVQLYTKMLAHALNDLLGERNVQMIAVSGEPEATPDGAMALSTSVKLKFFATTMAAALRWHPDLVICSHIGVAPAARYIQRFTGTPFWVALHGIEVWGELPPQKLDALEHAARLVSNSRFTLEVAAARHSLKTDNSAILPPAFFFDPDEQASAPAAKGDGPIVLTVGRLAASERYKGHDVMLQAWPKVLQHISGARCVFIGDGDDRSRLETLATQLGVASSVSFRGTVSGPDLHAAYASCSVFALPARTELDPRAPRGEGFGIVFLEAMAHGKPVVGPNTGAPAEFIRSGEHGFLVDPLSADEVAGVLTALLQDPDRAAQMGCAGRKWVQEQYSYAKFRERLSGTLSDPRP